MAKPIRYRWSDGCGNELTAGGVLVYDDEGVWAVLERRGGRDVLMDIGGRYERADGDIWFTIAREFCEETFHMVAVTRRDIMDLALVPGSLSFITNDHGRPVYVSLAVHTDALRARGVAISPEDFRRCRDRVVSGNPGVSYPTADLLHLPWAALAQAQGGPPLGPRLRKALMSPLIAAASKKAAE